MGRLRVKERETSTIVRLKYVVQKLQRVLLLCLSQWVSDDDQSDDEISVMGAVKKGHFSVFTMDDGDKPKKFFVALSYLNHPAFAKLLEETEREFGFDQQGVLVVPCQASELQRILSSLERIGGD